jgi:hypothetical protein
MPGIPLGMPGQPGAANPVSVAVILMLVVIPFAIAVPAMIMMISPVASLVVIALALVAPAVVAVVIRPVETACQHRTQGHRRHDMSEYLHVFLRSPFYHFL